MVPVVSAVFSGHLETQRPTDRSETLLYSPNLRIKMFKARDKFGVHLSEPFHFTNEKTDTQRGSARWEEATQHRTGPGSPSPDGAGLWLGS